MTKGLHLGTINDKAPPDSLSVPPDVLDHGRRSYEPGISFAKWSDRMLINNGNRVIPYLRETWKQVKRAEEGKGDRSSMATKLRFFIGGLVIGLLIGAGGVYSLVRQPHSGPWTDYQQQATTASSLSANPAKYPELRKTEFACASESLQEALELRRAGWVYMMPEPKSPQAVWGNHDGRTTWWVGYWTNERDQSSSFTKPVKDGDGRFVGDGSGFRLWRRGGSPSPPTEVEWLCSRSGGIQPR